ncbi:MAG: hypothetical protein QOF21_3018 [Actinomycetota bacterium]|jgi:hypothetical protein
MAELIMQTIDWIDHAPLRVEARAESTASPDKVFAVLADHERWPEWFPRLKQVTVIGQAEGVGARRRVALSGMTVDEEFIVWDPGARWTFTGYDARPRFTRSLVEDCVLTPLPNGGTGISYTMYMDPVGIAGFLVKRAVGQMRKNNTKAMQNLAARAAS